MKAMILAAGRGERMQPLTNNTPKPLLMAGSKYLIEYHLFNLAQAGFKDVVINVAWLGQKIIDTIGNGEKYNLNIVYSNEGEQALETGGGIFNALPLLGDEPFLVVNGDVWTDYPFKKLYQFALQDKAHLVLVENPEHHPEGDFVLSDNRLIEDDVNRNLEKYTFSGIGIYSADFFKDQTQKKHPLKYPLKYPLAPMIKRYITENKISGELYGGQWMDIGTVQRLDELINMINNNA